MSGDIQQVMDPASGAEAHRQVRLVGKLVNETTDAELVARLRRRRRGDTIDGLQARWRDVRIARGWDSVRNEIGVDLRTGFTMRRDHWHKRLYVREAVTR